MKRLRLGLIVVPLLSGVAWAAEPLTEVQMDAMTSGSAFSAYAIADASASGKVVSTLTATVAQVAPVTGGRHVILSVGDVALGPLNELSGAASTSALLMSRLPP